MPKRGGGSGGRTPRNRKLDKKNVRRQSNPQGKEGKVKAIKDDLEAEIRSRLPQMVLESELRQRDMAEVLGVGGPALELYIEQFELGYADATGENKAKPYGLDKENNPELELESREAILPWSVSDDANASNQPDRNSKRKPKRKPGKRK